MATSLNELVYDIINLARGGTASDDDRVSNRQVEFWIASTRSLLIRQDVNKKRSISENVIQSIPSIEVFTVDASSDYGINNKLVNCSVKRTIDVLPKPVESDNRDLILSVGSLNILNSEYSLVSESRAKFAGNTRWVKNIVKCFRRGSYLYVINDPLVKYINVRGVFENPMDLARFKDSNGNPLITRDSEYPISKWMIEMLKQLALQSNQAIFQIPYDTKNDAKSNSSVQVENPMAIIKGQERQQSQQREDN